MKHSKREAKSHTKYNSSLHEIRFKVLLFLHRLGGIPLKMNSASRLTTIYNATFMVCFYITYICVCVNTFVHRHQLSLAMKNFRIVLIFQLIVWLHFSVR